MSETKISLIIPAFKLNGFTELNSQNASYETGKQFYKAKLTKASPNGFNIGNTYQAYRIELNKQGISIEVQSSGTGTSTGMGTGHTGASPGTITPATTPTCHIDRPFVIFIRNNILKTTVYACCIKDLNN